MIPPLNENGYLPAGIHVATIDEIAIRFGRESELRRAQEESLRWLLDLAARAGVERVIVNGSFVTDVLEPNDVDCVLLVGSSYTSDSEAAELIRDGVPFLDLHLVEKADFDLLVTRIFGTDRELVPKGVIEVLL